MRDSNLKAVIKKMKRKFKSVDALEGVRQEKRGYLPSCVLPIDYVLGMPGFPLGRVVEIYGFESVGKSAIVAALIGACHQFGGFAALCDSEFSYTDNWAQMFGVIPKDLLMLNTDNLQLVGEQFVYLCNELSDSVSPVVLALDSVAATPVLEEVDSDLSGKSLGLHARTLSRIFRQLTSLIAKLNALFVATNQMKEKIGVYGSSGYTKIGGHTFDFHCAAQIQLKKTQLIKNDEGEIAGLRLDVFCVKNKLSRPYLRSSVDFYFDSGFDDSRAVLDLASQWGLVKKSGNGWYEFRGQKYQGKMPADVLEDVEKTVISTFYGELAPKVLQVRQLRKQGVGRVNGVSTNEDGKAPEVPREEGA